MPEIKGDPKSANVGRIAIVVSRYNNNITDNLRKAAFQTLTDHGFTSDQIDEIIVPGAWELALASEQLAQQGKYVALICLGAVIKGETTHDQHINRFVSSALGEISLDYGIPVSFGLLTCNTIEQAIQRSGGAVGNKGVEATLAALEMISLLKTIRTVSGNIEE